MIRLVPLTVFDYVQLYCVSHIVHSFGQNIKAQFPRCACAYNTFRVGAFSAPDFLSEEKGTKKFHLSFSRLITKHEGSKIKASIN